MTLAQNAQVQAALDGFMSAVRVIPNDGPGSKVSVSNKAASDFIDAIKFILLAEWSAGEEGLDFEAATHGPEIDRWLNEDELNAQFRARLAAEREKWEARVEELERMVAADNALIRQAHGMKEAP